MGWGLIASEMGALISHSREGTDSTFSCCFAQEDLDRSALAMPPASRRRSTAPQGHGGSKAGDGKRARLRGRALVAQLEKDLQSVARERVRKRLAAIRACA